MDIVDEEQLLDLGSIRWSRRASRATESPISRMMTQALADSDLISLAAGFVDYDTLPVREMRRIMRRLLGDEKAAQASLQYGTTEGYLSLRERIAERVARLDGVEPGERGYSPDNVLVGTGSQQLLYLMTEVLLDPGDIVVLGHPSYFVFMDALKAAGVVCRSVPMDAQGMRSDLLEELFETLKTEGALDRVKLLYLVTYFENPTGVSLSERRRREIYDVVRRFSLERQRIHMIEDAAYRELRYKGDDVPSLRSLDAEGRTVIYLGTFSKPFSPGLKTGYGIFPADLVESVANLKGAHDFGSGNFAQHVLDIALEEGLYDSHLKKLRRNYRKKIKAMTDALDCEMPAGAERTDPRGGLYVWVTLPEGLTTGPDSTLFKVALSRGVVYVPGEFCFADCPGCTVPRNCMRLSFGVGSPEKIAEGVRRLAKAAKECM